MTAHDPAGLLPGPLRDLQCVQQAICALRYRHKPDADFPQRTRTPRYAEPWVEVEDHLLRLLWLAGTDLDLIARILGRQEHAIGKHLNDVLRIQLSSPREWARSLDGNPHGTLIPIEELQARVFNDDEVPGWGADRGGGVPQ